MPLLHTCLCCKIWTGRLIWMQVFYSMSLVVQYQTKESFATLRACNEQMRVVTCAEVFIRSYTLSW